jgi:hypothetical protein
MVGSQHCVFAESACHLPFPEKRRRIAILSHIAVSCRIVSLVYPISGSAYVIYNRYRSSSSPTIHQQGSRPSSLPYTPRFIASIFTRSYRFLLLLSRWTLSEGVARLFKVTTPFAAPGEMGSEPAALCLVQLVIISLRRCPSFTGSQCITPDGCSMTCWRALPSESYSSLKRSRTRSLLQSPPSMV